MKTRTVEIHGLYPFRHVDLDVVAKIDYADGYLDLTELYVFSSRRNCMVRASDRLALAFQEKHWDHLQEQCDDNDRAAAEHYRELRADIADMKCHERMEREAEIRAA